MALEYKLCKPANSEIFIPEKILMSSETECTSSNNPFFFPNREQKHILNNFLLHLVIYCYLWFHQLHLKTDAFLHLLLVYFAKFASHTLFLLR